MAQREWLFGKDIDQLKQIAEELGMPRFAAAQIASWLYKKGATEIAQMSDLSLTHRERLAEQYEVGRLAPAEVAESRDGTKKYLFPTLQDGAIESAYIPDAERATLCVSSQAGCRMGCRFCATGRMGYSHDLTSGEILNQVVSIPESARVTNLVYMGMGEPLDNADEVLRSLRILTSPWGYAWSPTRITLSTIGMLPALDRFLEESDVHIAISLHNPFAAQRAAIMPVQNAQPAENVIATLKRHGFKHQRRLSFEYIVMDGMNDSPAHVKELCRLLDGVKCRINLIRLHTIPGSEFRSPTLQRIENLRDTLSRKGIVTTIRASRGEDIQAACGLLSTARLAEREK